MKKLILTAALSLGLAGSAFAQSGGFGDLVLGFRDNGTDGGTGTTVNTTIDLGSVSQFESGGAYYDPGVTVATSVNLGTDGLATTYGSSYLSDTGLLYGVVGTTGTGPSQKTLFVSAAATGSTLSGSATSTAWTEASKSAQGTQAALFGTLESNNAAGPNGVTTTATSVSTSWSTLESNAGGQSFGAYLTSLFEQNPTGNAVDLYSLVPTSAQGVAGTFLGTFSIDGSGNLDFTAVGAAIPEPSTYAMILGVAVLGVAVLRRRQQALAL